MAREKFVIRLLDAEDQLLGWAELVAAPTPQERGASCPYWPVNGRVTPIDIDRTGRATRIAVHWCDLDVARVTTILEPIDVEAGQRANWAWFEPVWLVGGMRDVPLPAVTTKGSVTIVVPTGNLAARDGAVV